MDSPGQPPYEVSELEQWLEGETIYKNPRRDDPGLLDPIMNSANFDHYSARKEWDDGGVTLVMVRKRLFIPRGEGLWQSLDFKRALVKPYFAWSATYNPNEVGQDDESSYRSYCERAGRGHDHASSRKIFKLMKRLYKAQK